MCTRKDFQLAVQIVKTTDLGDGSVINAFCQFFSLQNPRFDRFRFVLACQDALGMPRTGTVD